MEDGWGAGAACGGTAENCPLFSLFLLSFVLNHVPLYELCQILRRERVSKWEVLSWFLEPVNSDCSWTSRVGGGPSKLYEASGKGKWHHSDLCVLTVCITCVLLLSSRWHPAV